MPLPLDIFFAVAVFLAWTGFVYATGRKAGCKRARRELAPKQLAPVIDPAPHWLFTDRVEASR